MIYDWSTQKKRGQITLSTLQMVLGITLSRII